ncbi:SurA N-terminal domain-containing protein [Shewanella sedimentimangrovi]|uniref:Periplasmic chaperone PpiD n=1 Tax=Shewanella sedimentimangrovi TaxID=2814293 RepID=A0ABX7R3R5_9GAMM|nr:SurA N-terminal domain-containing protein [Shewanella sedimentimangrovi]QSX38472.1 SurA N-terminal domain-containing protein [Shewanella sedimentimangrovi]
MLEKIRDGSQSAIAKGILVLVILSFAFAGVSSYLGSTQEAPAASVNGEDISKNELEQAFQNEKARMEQQMGEMFAALSADDNYLRSLKQGVLDRLVAEKLMDQTAKRMGLRISDEQIKQAIMNEPAFQTDGKFDNDRYLAILSQMGYKTNSFRDMMRVDMTRRQLINGLVGSEFVLPGESTEIAKLQAQTRDVRFQMVDAEPFVAGISVSDEDAKGFYDANQDQFMTPELVSLEYVALNAADFAADISVSDDEAKGYYDEHQGQYRTAEKRLAAHILVGFGDDEAAAKAKAEALHQQLVSGTDFAELAKKESEDTFSGAQGGQLDWFEQGVMDPAFDGALFALEKGQYSEVVKSDFGFHIVKLLDVQGGDQASFESVKDKILAQLKEKQAVDKYYGLQQKLADISYEVPDTLAEAAKAIGAEVKSTELFARDMAPAELNHPEVLKAAFSDAVLHSGMNSEVVELAPNSVMVVRVKEHKAAGTQPFDEAKADIIARLTQEKANEAAMAKAQELLSKFNAGEALELETKAAVARYSRELDPSIVNKAFQMAVGAADTVSLASGYALVVLDKINEASSVDEATQKALASRMASQNTEAAYRALIDSLKANAEISYSAL